MTSVTDLKKLYESTVIEMDNVIERLEITSKDSKATTVFYAMSSLIHNLFLTLTFAAAQSLDAPVQTNDTPVYPAAYIDRFIEAVNFVNEGSNKNSFYVNLTYERKLEQLISEMLFSKEIADEFVAFINCDDEDGEIIFPDKKEMEKFLRTKMYERTS